MKDNQASQQCEFCGYVTFAILQRLCQHCSIDSPLKPSLISLFEVTQVRRHVYLEKHLQQLLNCGVGLSNNNVYSLKDCWNYYYDLVEDLRDDPMFPEFDSVFKSIYVEMYGKPREQETEEGANQMGRRVRACNGFQRRSAAKAPREEPAFPLPGHVDVASVQVQEGV